MTVASTLTSQQSACNGATTQFNFNNKIFSATDLIVTLIDTLGNLYAFTNGGSGNVFSNTATGLSYTVYNIDVDSGCYIVFSGPPALNWTCDMRTQVAELQSTSIKNQGSFLPELHEEFFDRATRMLQDLYRLSYTYSVHGNDIESLPWPSVGTPAQRANTNLGFGPSGALQTSLALLSGTLSAATISSFIYQQTAAESLTGLPITVGYPVGNMLRYGLVANSLAAATQNTANAKALFAYSLANGPTGTFVFPNATGSDVYYFNDAILCRPGCRLFLNGCTLSFSKTGVASDSQGGFIFATQDFELWGGAVIGNYSGSAFFSLFQFGARDVPVSGSPLPIIFDSLLPNYLANGVTMGKIYVHDVYLSHNNPNANVVTFFGGVNGVQFDRYFIEGNGQCLYGIYGEFGWATNQSNQYQRQTSHPHAHRYTNGHIQNVSLGNAGNAGITFNGGYDITVDNLEVSSAPQACGFGSGESLFFQPWIGVDDLGSIIPNGRNIHIRNVSGRQITSNGININGDSLASGGYLAGHVTIQDEVDQLNCTIESCTLDGVAGAGGYGILSTAANQTVKACKVTNFQRGIVTGTDCTVYSIEANTILNCASFGIQIGLSQGNFSPFRQSIGSIKGNFIAGSGYPSTGAAAILVAYADACVIEGNRFGYLTAHDNISEPCQTNAVSVSTNSAGVICRSNVVAATFGGAVAYSSISVPGLLIDNPLGNVTTFTGPWMVRTPATGFGTPTGGALLTNFPGASATLPQTSAQLAYLLTQLKSQGIIAT